MICDIAGMKLMNKMIPDGFMTGTPPMSISGVKAKFSEPASQRHFTEDDINSIEIFLDKALEDNSTGSMSIIT